MTGAALANMSSCNQSKPNMEPLKNWAGNLTYGTSQVLEPANVQEVQDIVRSNSSIRVLGTRHCFNGIADTKAVQLSTKKAERHNFGGPTIPNGEGRRRYPLWRAMQTSGSEGFCHSQSRFASTYFRGRSMRNSNARVRSKKWEPRYIHIRD